MTGENASTFDNLEVGDIFRCHGEDIVGHITEIYRDELDNPVVVVVRNYDGMFRPVDLTRLVPCKVVLH